MLDLKHDEAQCSDATSSGDTQADDMLAYVESLIRDAAWTERFKLPGLIGKSLNVKSI